MGIKWFNEPPKQSIATLTAGSITLNKPATMYFENAYSVMLGIDLDHHMVVIKSLSKSEAVSHAIPDNKKIRITVRSSYSRITNKAFMDDVAELLGISFGENSIKFPTNWDHKEQVLMIDLKGDV
jgi:hypothetical protein